MLLVNHHASVVPLEGLNYKEIFCDTKRSINIQWECLNDMDLQCLSKYIPWYKQWISIFPLLLLSACVCVYYAQYYKLIQWHQMMVMLNTKLADENKDENEYGREGCGVMIAYPIPISIVQSSSISMVNIICLLWVNHREKNEIKKKDIGITSCMLMYLFPSWMLRFITAFLYCSACLACQVAQPFLLALVDIF